MASKAAGKPAFSTPAVVILAAILVAAAGLFILEVRSRPVKQEPQSASAEAKAYVRNLKLSNPELTEAESFTGARVVALSGKIRNAGDRPVGHVELICIFQDLAGNVIGRERLAIVKQSLRPDEARDFRLPFENIPPGWNQHIPQLVIANIQFGE